MARSSGPGREGTSAAYAAGRPPARPPGRGPAAVAATLGPVRLLLVRHGRTASNVGKLLDTAYPGAALDAVGRAQADGLVDRLAGVPIDAIYTSDLTRSRQTAEPLAAARGLAPVAHAGLREIQAGDLEMSDRHQAYVEVLLGWRGDLGLRVPGGESGHEVLERFDGVLRQAAVHDHVVAITHGAVIRMWAALRTDNGTLGVLRGASMDNAVVVELDGHPARGWTVLRWAGASVPPAPADPSVDGAGVGIRPAGS